MLLTHNIKAYIIKKENRLSKTFKVLDNSSIISIELKKNSFIIDIHIPKNKTKALWNIKHKY